MFRVFRAAPRGIRVLAFSSYLMGVGYYALIPYLALHLTKNLAWSMTLMGAMFATRQLSQSGTMFFAGAFADRIGWKQAIVLGVTLRGVGFLAFGACSEVYEFFGAAVISGLGGALFSPASQAAFEALTPDENREQIIALREVVDNVAFGTSTLIGMLLSSIGFVYLSTFSSAIFFSVGVVVYFLLPTDGRVSRPSILKNLRYVVSDRPFLVYTAILTGYHYLDAQLYYTVPQKLTAMPGGNTNLTLFYSTVAITIILFQLRLTAYFEHFEQRMRLLSSGTLLMGVMLYSLSFVSSTWMLVPVAILFSTGMMLSSPIVFEMVAAFGKKDLMAAYYGFNAYALAVGGALGATLGGWTVDYGRRIFFNDLPWTVCLWVGVGVAVSLTLFERMRQPGPVMICAR